MSPKFLIVAVFVLSTISYKACAIDGTATYYTRPYQPSACNGFEDDGVMIAAASDDLWNGGGACGSTYTVTCVDGTNEGDPHPCNGNSVTVTIVDYCPPPGCKGTIDLSEEAFAQIANTDAAKIQISYQNA